MVGQAADGREAIARARETMPDVVLMDVRMPVMDGIEATRQLRAAGFERLGILMLTTFDLDEYVYEALRAGASGFMLKDVPRATVVEGVRTIAAGDSLLAPAITRRLIERYAAGPPERSGAAAAARAAQPARARHADPPRARPLERRDRRRARRSARPRSRRTSPPCCASSSCATAPRPSSGPTSRASCAGYRLTAPDLRGGRSGSRPRAARRRARPTRGSRTPRGSARRGRAGRSSRRCRSGSTRSGRR